MQNRYSQGLWLIGIGFYGIGDLVTTFYGIMLLGATETMPIPVYFIETYGLWSLIPIKFMIIGFLYLLNTRLPYPYNTPCPILLCVFGAYAVINNSNVILGLL